MKSFYTERDFCGGFTIRWAHQPPGHDLQGWYPDEESWEDAQDLLFVAGHSPHKFVTTPSWHVR